MANYTIVMDLNRCVGCMGCNAACKTVNEVPIGNFWNKVVRFGPTPMYEGAKWPDVEWYYLPMQCQHCTNPQCVEVCPTGASAIDENGRVEIDPEMCIGCGLCTSACPYGVRYINMDTNVAQKCTMCKDLVDEGGLPQCVTQCAGLAKYFGDLDEDPTMMSFKGGYNTTLGESARAFTEDDIHTLEDTGNGPKIRYILREKQFITELPEDVMNRRW